jgi:putative ABC transport system permease protein
MDRWLQGFAYRIDITAWPFFVSGICALFLSLAIVMYQALKAARINPVDALRNE